MLGFDSIARKVFGTANDRKVKGAQKTVDAVNALEPQMEALRDDELAAKTGELRDRLANGATLDELLPEAFAVVREAAKRTLGMRPFDVQIIGGLILHEGKIAEMKTGEGKTLVATMPVYLNALEGKGVHVVTVNDYLARRDAEWMGAIYRFLGMTVGVIVPGLDDAARRAAYACDVTYGTNNELGFDYLRDNMKYELAQMTQRGHRFAIVDEVDSILIDEARTPLIISGPLQDQSEMYIAVDKVIPELEHDHYDIDEKQRSVVLTEDGNEFIEQKLIKYGLMEEGSSLYDPQNVSHVHHVNQALRAHKLFQRDKDYIVKSDKVIIIDEFTGRMMDGRRYGDGLHQALEAKEHVKIEPENQTLASVTFQNYFRLYDKLAGMTGTALTEAAEFMDIYGLDVVEIPTNLPVVRQDDDDQVFRTGAEKDGAVVEAIRDGQKRGQPILVGTTSIEKSELLSALLKKAGVEHSVLNARYHEQEAHIVAQAGHPGRVTIATNMAGRGTDIKLGGNAEFRIADETQGLEGEALAEARRRIEAEVEEGRQKALAAGGLWVLATERHESRRIDNQLRGRSGRQGDPGRSSFFLSLQDDLMRIFGSDRIDGMLQRLGLEEGEAIVHPWVNKAIEKAQGKVEARNFDIRKNLLKFDDVMNDQRKAIFSQRREFMEAADLSEFDPRHAPPGHRRHGRRLHPQARLPRAVAGRRSAPARRRDAGSRVPRQGMGGRGRRRRRRHPRASLRRDRPALCREGRQGRRRDHAQCREAASAAGPRQALARAPRASRPPALGHPPARLCPARPAERVQVRSLPAVRRAAGGATRRGDAAAWPHPHPFRGGAGRAPAHDGRGRDADAPADGAAGRGPGERARRRRRGDGRAGARGARAGRPLAADDRRRPAGSGAAGRRARSRRPGDLGKGGPQRAVPLRLGQEVQALPRPDRRLTAALPDRSLRSGFPPARFRAWLGRRPRGGRMRHSGALARIRAAGRVRRLAIRSSPARRLQNAMQFAPPIRHIVSVPLGIRSRRLVFVSAAALTTGCCQSPPTELLGVLEGGCFKTTG